MSSNSAVIANWYSSATIDYLSPFMKLWVSFNSWYNITLSNPKKDYEAINKLKLNQDLLESLRKNLNLKSDEGNDFRKALSNLVEETKNQPLINIRNKNVLFLKSDITDKIKKKYQHYLLEIVSSEFGIEKQTLEEFTNSNNGIRLDDNFNVIVANEPKQIFNELIEVIYQVRCHIFHGSFDTQNKRTQRLVKNSYICLVNLFRLGLGGV